MNASMGDYSSFEGQISLLRPATLVKLSHILNPTKVLLTDDGHLRDWRGLAELFGCDALSVQNMEASANPFVTLMNQPRVKEIPVYRLIQFLEMMDRYDAIDDTIALMENDLHLASTQAVSNGIQHGTPQLATIGDLDYLNETGTLPQYDAFVLYAHEDQSFVDRIVEKMEGEYGLKLCLKDRDLMAGMPFEHQAVTELISNRCRFVLPIFSPHFVNSKDNEFVVSFSEALGIERGCRKIVPCIYEPCTLPKTVCYYTKLDYTRQNQHWDFWDKMRKSLVDSSAHQRSGEQRKTSTSSVQEQKKGATPTTPTPDKAPLFVKIRSRSSLSDSAASSASQATSLSSPLVTKEEPIQEKHWLKKIIKRSKKKTADKQKMKATAA